MLQLHNFSLVLNSRIFFRDVNCRFLPGRITAIRKTGVLDGSSTLLKCCAGLVEPTDGDVLFNDMPVDSLSEDERFATLCYCYEQGGLISLFTVYNNLAMPLVYHRICDTEEAHQRIHLAAEKLGVSDLLELEPHQLNDVQFRLVNLVRALVVAADVILTDELQAGMSPAMLNNVVDILTNEAEKGVTIVMVTTSGDDDGFADEHYQISNTGLELLT